MATIDRNTPPTNADIEIFLKNINFQLPQGFIEFYKETNGADLSGTDVYVVLWPLTDLIKLNDSYNVQIYAPEFFIFGSDGGDTAYVIEKQTGNIFEMPFIGMSKEEAVYKSKSFNEFIESI
jgi:SMI1 / KNR4 family (SUKH-1)